MIIWAELYCRTVKFHSLCFLALSESQDSSAVPCCTPTFFLPVRICSTVSLEPFFTT